MCQKAGLGTGVDRGFEYVPLKSEKALGDAQIQYFRDLEKRAFYGETVESLQKDIAALKEKILFRKLQVERFQLQEELANLR